ncbi:hybrid sensor histidine kinase/response regulator [Deltaproteobacteria bacterium Smac51]|nr:hybrid sensor histidine kinase/response regulator [Deltaproteobacteria bacterium Smac51]
MAVRKSTANFDEVLAKLTKMPELSNGALSEAAHVIAHEGCTALNTHRVGIWTIFEDAKFLKSLAYFDSETGEHSVQDNFDLLTRKQYADLLRSERLIVINDIRESNALSDVVDGYGPKICSLLDAPIRTGGKLSGVVCIEQDRCEDYPQRRIWTREEQNFASSLADLMALALMGTERRYLMKQSETLMNNLPGMVYQCLNDPPDFSFIFVSDGCLALTGYTRDELLGNSTFKFFDMVHPDDVATLAKQNAETLSVGLPLETTFRVVMKDGSIKWIWERSHIVEYTPDGRPYMLEGFYADITSQRRLEAAEAESRSKSNFLARMSHEIRTPMNAIIGMAELALREDMSDAAREHTLAIKHAGANLLTIINDILDLSKVERGQIEVISEEYLFSSLVNDLIEIIRMRMFESRLRLIINIDSHMPNKLVGDVVKIRQVLTNLLSNAVKYTDKGHVIFSVDWEKTAPDEAMLVISVSDTGRGIKEQDLNKLFGEFVQLDLDKNKGIEGTGLGLSIARHFVHAMGGEIDVASTYGQGSTFTVRIPQKVVSFDRLACVEHPPEKRVLTFERREMCAESISRTMDNLGVDSRLVTQASAFLEELRTGEYAFAFVAAGLYPKVEEGFTSLGGSTQLVLIEEFGEAVAYRDYTVLRTPVYAVPVANILNGSFSASNDPSGLAFSVKFTAPSARVLVVDDINTNLKVAEGLMSPYRMRVDVCESGFEAIEAVKDEDYDLIFMDHMMPEMDGIETMLRIRAMEEARDVPIVALTANAVSGMKEMFKEKGFDDYLSKPIDMVRLNSILAKWLPREKQKSEIKSAPAAVREKEITFTIEGLNVPKGVARAGGSVKLYLETLAVFRKDGQGKMAELSASLKDDNLALYTTNVHALKSALAYVGAEGLAKAAASLESAGREGDKGFIETHNTTFLPALARLLDNIAACPEIAGDDEPETLLDKERLREILDPLRTALDEFDTETINRLSDHLQGFTRAQESGDSVGAILEQILTGGYDEAIEKIDDLLPILK